jgi:hypothetical protein
VLEVVFAGALCYTGVSCGVQCLTGLTGGALSAQVFGEKEFNLVVMPIHPPLSDIKVLSIGIRVWCSDSSLTTWSSLMSTTCEVPFEPLALDDSNYSSWCSNVLIALKVLGSTAKRIMVASILLKDEICVSPKELEKKRLNVIVTNLLCSCVCRELKYLILKSKRIGEDALLIWKLLFELVNTKWDEVECDDEDEPAEMCPTTSTSSTDHQASNLEQEEDQRSEDAVPLQGPIRPVTPTSQTGASRGTPICLMAKKEKKSKKKR